MSHHRVGLVLSLFALLSPLWLPVPDEPPPSPIRALVATLPHHHPAGGCVLAEQQTAVAWNQTTVRWFILTDHPDNADPCAWIADEMHIGAGP